MTLHNAFARELRLRRLFRYSPAGLLLVPLDHSVTTGPISREPGGLNRLVGRLSENNVDAVVLHKGCIRQLDHAWFAGMSLIVHLSASTVHAPDADAKYLVATVPEALRLGADAVSVHLNMGCREEPKQVADLALVAGECDSWNLPLLVMAYPRGPDISNPHDPALLAHAATLSADLGADIVKLPYAGSVADMAEVIRSCPVPVIVAGGARLNEQSQILGYVDEVLQAGAAGLAMGRNVFQAPDPGKLARLVAGLVHRSPPGLSAASESEQLAAVPA
jgi:2-amino-4,5-dihydroxy-6-oxo-7-(phosphonooxy)heptanoate synthase